MEIDRCRAEPDEVSVEWTKVDVRASLFRCSVCRCLFLELDRDVHAADHAKAA